MWEGLCAPMSGACADRGAKAPTTLTLFLFKNRGARDALAFQENIRDRGKRPHILQRIAVDDEQRCLFSFFDRADAVVGAQQFRGVEGRRLERDFRWNAGRDPELDFTLHGRAMETRKLPASEPVTRSTPARQALIKLRSPRSIDIG